MAGACSAAQQTGSCLIAVSSWLLLLVLITVVGVKKLSDRFMVLPNRRVLAIGTLAFAIEALWVNLARRLNYPAAPPLLDHLGFAAFLLSFGYVAVQIAYANEHRLLSIEHELALARKLQLSILPTTIPEVHNIRIAAAYQPMTSVAGDFYEFVPIDGKQVGILVADLTGHGVPAALIASTALRNTPLATSLAGPAGRHHANWHRRSLAIANASGTQFYNKPVLASPCLFSCSRYDQN